MMTASLLSVRDLRVDINRGRRRAPVVDGVSFDINEGETFAIVGESGCGKSMTALALMRLVPAAARLVSGSVHLAGRDLLELTEGGMREVRGRELAMIFQEPNTSLNPVLTVARQIGEVLERQRGLRGNDARARTLALLDAVGIADAQRRLDEYPFQLSGGMKQRVMIAMALAGDPKMLIADEPTTALDVTIQAQILDLLRVLQRERRMGMLLISHDLGIVAEMAQRVAVMYAGEIVEVAGVTEFFAAPCHPYAKKLFAALPDISRRGALLETIPGQVPSVGDWPAGCRFAARCPAAFGLCRERAPEVVAISATHTVRCHLYAASETQQKPGSPRCARDDEAGVFARSAATWQSSALVDGELDRHHESKQSVLDAVDLRMHFPIRGGLLKRTVGSVRAVDGVSLTLARGRTLALVGESGCGKTTVGKALLQLVGPGSGSIRLAGRELMGLSRREMRPLRRKIQMIFQDPFASLNPRMRVGEIISEGMAALQVVASASLRDQAVHALLAQVGLPAEAALRYPHEFSGGQRQRIAIARTLAVQPDVIVCDEPTSALDVSVQAQILNLLRELQERLDLSYLFITHNFAVVEYLAHEVAVMYLGRIVEFGSVADILRDPRHPYTVALLSAVPVPDPGQRRERLLLAGETPSPAHPPAGCHFHLRCAKVMDICRRQYPEATQLSASHRVSCHLFK